MRARLTGLSLGIASGLLLATSALAPCAQAGTDAPPRVDSSYPNPQPPYPDSAQLSGEAGTVMVDVYVRSNGRPTKVKVSQSSGFTDLDTAAVQGVLNWHFVPAVRDGDTVSDWTTVKIVYNLPTPATNGGKTTSP